MDLLSYLRPLVLRLSEPHASVQDPTQQRQARYLSIAMIMFAMIEISASVVLMLTVGFNPIVPILIGALMVAVGCYMLGRSRYFRMGIFIASMMAFLFAYGTLLFFPTSQNLVVIVFPVFLVSLFYSLQTTFITAIVLVVSSFVIPLLVDGQWQDIQISLVFISTIAAIFVLNMALRQNMENSLRRQTEKLQDNEVQLRGALETLLENERLKVELEKERELIELKGNMMETISHEFRTPLAIILNSRDILFRYHNRLTESQRQDRLNIIADQVQHLNNLISRVNHSIDDSTTQMSMDLAPINLNTMCEILVKEYQTNLGTYHHLVYTHEGELRGLFLHKLLIRYMLSNLLSNSIKYSPKGSTITLHVKRADDLLTIRVRDEGIGILPSDIPRVFEPLFRGRNVGAIGGTGLGLAIVQKGIQSHRGTVTIDSKPNHYTEFTIQLPLDETYTSIPQTPAL
jgi:signal transduction histidine kinase